MKTLLFLSSLTGCYRSGKSLRAVEPAGAGLVDCQGLKGLVDFKGLTGLLGLRDRKGLLVKTAWMGLMDSKGLLGLRDRKGLLVKTERLV